MSTCFVLRSKSSKVIILAFEFIIKAAALVGGGKALSCGSAMIRPTPIEVAPLGLCLRTGYEGLGLMVGSPSAPALESMACVQFDFERSPVHRFPGLFGEPVGVVSSCQRANCVGRVPAFFLNAR